MESPELVETSDPEELEIVHRAYYIPPKVPALSTNATEVAVLRTPRKRRKISHSAYRISDESDKRDGSLERFVTRDVDDGSTTPAPSSPGLPTSTAVSDDERPGPTHNLTTKDPFMMRDLKAEPDGLVLSSPVLSGGGFSLDIAFDLPIVASQDELNIISQPLSPTNPVVVNATLATSALDSPILLSGEEHQSNEVSTELVQSPATAHSPAAHTAVSPRLSSLPPSSPPRISSSVTSTPQRFRSHQPGYAVPIQPQSRQGQSVGDGQLPSGDGENAHQFEEHDDDGMAPRRYSLRARQARQLNPYEYDKRLYKQQMRRLPDAIVKIVSPQRHGSGRGHKQHDVLEHDDFIVPEEEGEETQATTRRKAKRHRTSDAPDENDGFQESLSWLPGAFHMSDDDELAPLSPLVASEAPSKSNSKDMLVSRKTRRKQPQKCPFEESKSQNANDSQHNEREEAENVRNSAHSTITYKRRKDTRSSINDKKADTNGQVSAPSETNLRGSSSSSPIFQHYSFEAADETLGDNGLDFDYGSPYEEQPARIPNTAGTVSPFSEDSEYGGQHLVNIPATSHTVPNSSTKSGSENGEEPRLPGLTKKQMRILGRMVPKIMLKRFGTQGRAVPKRSARSRSKSVTDGADSSSESDEPSLAPGRSRITKRSVNSHLTQIRGDSESSESEVGVRQVKKLSTSVIKVESSSDSDASETCSLKYETDDGVLDDAIAEAGYFDHDFSRHSTRRREEPLIDMMLCRTRTKRASSRRKSKKSRSGVSSKTGDHTLRPDVLNVSIPSSTTRPHSYHHINARHRQTRLQFTSSTNHVDDYHDKDVIDLTGMEEVPAVVDDSGDDIAGMGDFEPPERLTKKQRRETAQKATLHTIVGHNKKIGSGRRKGFIIVQIDMADDGLQKAIKPLHSDSPLRNRQTFNRTTSSKSERRPHQISHQRRHAGDSRAALKQTSLHDFASGDAAVLGTFEYAAPMRPSGSTQAAVDWHSEDKVRTCTLDLGISIPTSGLAFPAWTYLGKQLLPDLLNFTFNNGSLSRPSSYGGFGVINLNAEMTCSCFVEAIEAGSNTISEWLNDEPTESIDGDNIRRYEHLMHNICHFAAWVYTHADDEGKKIVQTAVVSCSGRFTSSLQEILEKSPSTNFRPDLRYLAVAWFSVELTTRMLVVAWRRSSEMDPACWKGAVTLLVHGLIRYGIEKALDPVDERDMSSATVSLRTAELWICLIHLLPPAYSLHHVLADVNGVFWSIVLQVVKDVGKSTMSNIEVSEDLWKLIFGLCALSHFSAHGLATSESRLPPCWDIVGLALDTIRLTHDKTQDALVSRETLKRRDRYVRMVVARCFVLGTRWNWPLGDANAMFKKLVDIFRSRNFGNLLGEESEFPAFLRYHNIRLLEELRSSDTAFGLYLKLVMQATKTDLGNDGRTKARLTKLLSLVVPLSGVAFSRTSPPTTDELSTLINRFSAIVSAILVEGKENSNLQSRVSQARRFVSFDNTDDRSRDVCIRAAMYISIAVKHLALDLAESLNWLGEMCQTLLGEFQNSRGGLQKQTNTSRTDDTQRLRHRLVLSLHLLLRCVTNIIERANMGVDDTAPRYPDVRLISGPWVKSIFPLKELTNIVSTRIQMLQLVQSFLNVREKVIPPPRRSASVSALEDNLESQDLFAEFEMDDDILAHVPLDGKIEDVWEKDREVAEIMNSEIVPHIFRLLLQYFTDPTARPADESKLEDYWSNADDWIDCWVGCAAIVVRNEKRSWDHYLNVGPASWAGIGDSFFRRRVAVRFMYKLLKCDPRAYNKDYERRFFSVLLQCLVAHRVTMENAYLSTLLSIDGLHHPLLRELPLDRPPEQEDFRVSRADFLQMRREIVSCVFFNLNSVLLSDASERDKNVLVECVLEMLAAMQDIWKNLSSAEDRDRYGELCRHVFSTIRQHARIHGLQRLSTYVAWGDASFNVPMAA